MSTTPQAPQDAHTSPVGVRWRSPFATGDLPGDVSGAVPVTARCVRIATGPVGDGALRAVVIVQYRLEPGDGQVVIRGLLRAGWDLVPAPVAEVVPGPDSPRLRVAVDDVGELDLTSATGGVLFSGAPQQPITPKWVHLACQQRLVPVLVGVWGVDLGTDVDLTGCARAGKLLGAGAIIDRSQPC